MLHGKRVLLIISGGIAAYKSLELIRIMKKTGLTVRCILTKGGAEFVTPLAVSSLSENKVYKDLFSLTDEAEMGHIRLSRETDLIVIAPASADLLAKMAQGIADDLASTTLLATNKPVMAVPAMNVRMWENAATQENLNTLHKRGIKIIGPDEGDMACGEFGPGRMVEPEEISAEIIKYFGDNSPLAGKKALVTSGPTQEPIDPVRFISNRSSGKQGHAIAAALARQGAITKLVSGPTNQPDPAGVEVEHIETAQEMLNACQAALPVDIAVCAAAVSDWHINEEAKTKIKKTNDTPPTLRMATNPDILATLSSAGKNRPTLVIGFAAETDNIVANAKNKRDKKGCDWLLANDVSAESGTFGGSKNTIHFINDSGIEDWPEMTKKEVAETLSEKIIRCFNEK
ncbi:MAG: bifunctional phosphopantothenoylcysteine decarboxylase/phosphopantothenate--cysteine ligase CoaBC [Alphaproteobacteria bacterium]|nr:bifunctional phosphopantothenoylcysteine decarboxylase/phosphopantothenate--cysteine ligase CoaBC [Alphaproteobacteria bacterium]